MNAIKDYLGTENARNKKYAALYERLIKAAYGANNAVLIGHHLTFERTDMGSDNISTENEIPSADCLLFDHEIMTRVFGDDAIPLMQQLAALPCDQREALIQARFEKTDAQWAEVNRAHARIHANDPYQATYQDLLAGWNPETDPDPRYKGDPTKKDAVRLVPDDYDGHLDETDRRATRPQDFADSGVIVLDGDGGSDFDPEDNLDAMRSSN